MKLIEFQKVAKILAKEYKIKIEEGQSWAANIKNRIVFYRKNDIFSLPEEHILGLLLHEVAHIHYTTDVTMPAKNPELTHTTLNMIEDISIENIIGKDYPNAGDILESTKEEVLDTLIQILPKMDNASIFEKSLLYAAARFENRGYEFGTEPYEKLGNKIAAIMLKDKKGILDRKETKDLMPMVEKIVKLIIKEAGEPTEEEKRKMMQNNQEGNATGDQEQQETKDGLIKRLKGGKGWEGIKTVSPMITFVNEIADQATAIGKQLRTVLKRNNAMEYGGRYRTGKLLAKRFVRIKVLKDRNPFTRRIIKSNQSYAFAIASDISGSMFPGGSNATKNPGSYALTSMHMVGEALRYAAIPRSLIIFGENANIVAPMNKLQATWEQIANRDALNIAETGSTDIAKAIDACTQELNKVRAERKIMIVLTDGESDLNDMQEAHKKAKEANIECLGITIGHQGGNSLMDRTFSPEKNKKIDNINNTSLIGKAFIDILKASVTKSL